MPSKEEILDFLDKNKLNIKDLKEITGKGDSTVRDWLASLKDENSKSKFPKEIWLLLNALFNRESSLVTEIVKEYSKGDAFVNNPELVREFHDEVQVMKDTTRSWNEMNQMDRVEKIITGLHKKHLKKVKKEWNIENGLGSHIRIQDREVYNQIRKKEKELDIVTSVAIEDLENLSDRYSSGEKDDGFIKKLLEIYDDYMAGFEKMRLFDYIDKLKNATEEDIRVIYGKWDKSSKKRKIIGRYLPDSPEHAKEIKSMSMTTLYDMENETESDIKNAFQEDQKAISDLILAKRQLQVEVAELKKERDSLKNDKKY